MSEHTIDTAMAKRMAQARAIHGAAIIGQPGGWSVMLLDPGPPAFPWN